MFLVARRRTLLCVLPCMTCLHGSSDCRAGLAATYRRRRTVPQMNGGSGASHFGL
jgi:hypothetical protein